LSVLISGIDLALLSQANHSIMTYGTFGMWGALLAGVNFTHNLVTTFLYKSVLFSFSLNTVWHCNLLRKNIGAKAACKMIC
jgi:hypothetical protein